MIYTLMIELFTKLVDKFNCISNTRRIESLEERMKVVEGNVYTKEWIDQLNTTNEEKHEIQMSNVEKAIHEMSLGLKENHLALMSKYDQSERRITENAIKLSGIDASLQMMNDMTRSRK